MNKLSTYARTAYLQASKLIWPSSAPRVVHTRVDGRHLLVLANEDVGRQIVLLRRYERRDSQAIASALRADDICVDVGANTGYYTMLMAAQATAGHVHAFEPSSLNIHLLRASAALNGAVDAITASQCALGAERGSAAFTETLDGAYSSFRPTGRKLELRTVEVPVTTLDGYLADNDVPRVDVMKVDVEGAEKLVLDGATELLADADRRPRLVLLELYDPMLGAFGTSVADVVSMMRGLGYRPAVATEHGRLQDVAEGQAPPGYNVFFTI